MMGLHLQIEPKLSPKSQLLLIIFIELSSADASQFKVIILLPLVIWNSG